jgi:pimeloyl-ACP methyl ester carboxylesterase
VKDGFGQQILAHYMISQGIALLTYDKRGVGASEGLYRESPSEANINLIASDAVAGTDYLSTRAEIDPAKIGLIGGSQAGWVIPVAVVESDVVDFFVIESGPVVSFAQEDYYSSVTNDGDTATIYDAEKLDQTLREMKPSGVNPIPVLSELSQPGLWLWGSVDKNVPFKVSAENLQTLIDYGKDNFSYTILPNGDHNLNETEHGYFDEIPYSPRVLYFSKLTEWLEKNVLQ